LTFNFEEKDFTNSKICGSLDILLGIQNPHKIMNDKE